MHWIWKTSLREKKRERISKKEVKMEQKKLTGLTRILFFPKRQVDDECW